MSLPIHEEPWLTIEYDLDQKLLPPGLSTYITISLDASKVPLDEKSIIFSPGQFLRIVVDRELVEVPMKASRQRPLLIVKEFAQNYTSSQKLIIWSINETFIFYFLRRFFSWIRVILILISYLRILRSFRGRWQFSTTAPKVAHLD